MNLASIGDVCVDIYSQKNLSFLGGSAFNFSLAAQVAGADTSLISAVGSDHWGKQYLSILKKNKVNSTHLAFLSGKTSQVNVTLDENKSPLFSRWQLGVLEAFRLTTKHATFLKNQAISRCVCFKPMFKLFEDFCTLRLPQTVKVVDFAGGSIYSPSLQTINQSLSSIDLAVRSTNQKEISQLKQLAVKFNKLILATLGKEGSVLFSGHQEFHQPAVAVNTIDATGAGDAYQANFLIEYYLTKNISQAMKFASRAAGRKVAHLGSTSFSSTGHLGV